ncbi:ion transporter [Thiohalobacter sp.]|uniref:ion transporter n=1 Tax=Thiohalobacter sp. TaxID=2025948 RepID=UPI0026181254|nr:ion transporter [Thiohalobacter sp.]
MYRLLEPAPGARGAARWVTLAIVTLVLLNVLANILASIDAVYAAYGEPLFAFEVFSTLAFTLEYGLRLWSSVESPDPRFHSPILGRLRFAATPMLIIDLIAILPFYLLVWTQVDLLFLRVFRLFRIFKLTRYSPAMTLLMTVLRREARAFGAAGFILLVVLIFAASGMYLVEHEAQPEAFGSIPAAMWWAVATLTTVGYGDVTPITPWGKFFGATITIIGVGMVALPAGILASAFSDELRRRREEYLVEVEEALEDGRLSRGERRKLTSMRKALGLDREEAERLLRLAEEEKVKVCPHCGEPLDG